MSNFLFVTWNGGGNQPPERDTAAELQARGHHVRWLTLPAHPPNLAALRPEQRTPAVIAQVMTNPTNLDELTADLAKAPADAIVVDCMLFGALAAAQLLELPVCCFIHSVPGAFGGPTPGFPSAALLSASIAEMLDKLGLPVEHDPWTVWAAANPIVASFRELDVPAAAAVPEFDWIGPVVPRPSTPREATGKNVILSLSTYPGFRALEQPKAQRILDGVAGLDLAVQLTAPALDVDQLRIPANVTVHGYVPHRDLLDDAALVITHGGHGTLCTSLAYGVPALVIPNMAADQPYLGERIQQLGAGRNLPYDAEPDQINSAVRTILQDDSYHQAARELQATILATPGTARAADRIEDIVATAPSRTTE
jgi:hypothetical protein